MLPKPHTLKSKRTFLFMSGLRSTSSIIGRNKSFIRFGLDSLSLVLGQLNIWLILPNQFFFCCGCCWCFSCCKKWWICENSLRIFFFSIQFVKFEVWFRITNLRKLHQVKSICIKVWSLFIEHYYYFIIYEVSRTSYTCKKSSRFLGPLRL